MENLEKNLLTSFQQEIDQFRREEIEGKRPTVHLMSESFNVTELTDYDRLIWEKIKNETITFEEFSKYRSEVTQDSNQSRLTFMAMAANKAMVPLNKKY